MPIKVLDQLLVSKIAAGEVVERPASVVKELVENALDANATLISVEVQGGGTSLIRVADSGCGIPENEVELAFHRYATSKIDRLTDLERINTLGFRGEALPSIAAVADVEITTIAEGEAVGNHLKLQNGDIVSREKIGRPRGTTVTVRHLFRNVPARLKFLKSPTTENGHIANLVSQYALAYPEVGFTLSIDDRTTLQTTGNGILRDVAAEVYGMDIATGMLNIEQTDGLPLVTGLISPPSLSRSTRDYLSFFVNRRWVRSGLLAKAVTDAYRGQLMSGKYPFAILNIALPPEDLEVNVHPAKTEVRFRYSQSVYTAVIKAIERSLAQAPLPQLKTEEPTPLLLAEGFDIASLPILRVLGQLSSSYILAEGPFGLYLIDQHAAHERILFEKILEERSQQKLEIQGLLEPVTIELSPQQEQVLTEKGGLLVEFGFALEPFGGRSYLLRALPAVVKNGDPAEAVKNLLDSLANDEEPAKREEKIAESLACHSAIRAGESLTYEEMRELVRQLEQTQKPRTCPHGRPSMIHLSSRQLEREFRRTGP
ncbi:MAG: DNA mismatch repair endonuclease MutL [Chloroflexi bacterium]|nr:DNA mismatch repair endonuclease MutL [Chloroflexota bacterium]MBM3172828.1 DNA mismatch repair endonuclease MutL [Chloroflexota bacterium]MBM3174859.1 DNA mismatch repair endonuclease MutL [Chloroflexota bacterium]MBM4450904.1 DNA mismatch repair endonuclease MutL [Chloroflexota bacterium]